MGLQFRCGPGPQGLGWEHLFLRGSLTWLARWYRLLARRRGSSPCWALRRDAVCPHATRAAAAHSEPPGGPGGGRAAFMSSPGQSHWIVSTVSCRVEFGTIQCGRRLFRGLKTKKHGLLGDVLEAITTSSTDIFE